MKTTDYSSTETENPKPNYLIHNISITLAARHPAAGAHYT